ncbi:mobilization protein [Chitinilyticum piscinae]|uniref:mobilization protein n=1 Tax=Chitinilyticum piscinae TaxID=2866724 RepID=UPI001D165381|nr:mobilization protein [Chitinilyticum piscinae]
MADINDKISKLEEQLKQAKAQRQKIEARKRAADAKRSRAEDTRRKILAGALVLEMMERDETARGRFMERLDAYLTRPDDRALFGLQDHGAQPNTPPSPPGGSPELGGCVTENGK